MSLTERILLILCILIPVGVIACNTVPVTTHLEGAKGNAVAIRKSADSIDATTKTVTGNEPQKQAITKTTKTIRTEAGTLLDHLNGAITGNAKITQERDEYKAKYEAEYNAWPNWLWRKCKLVVVVLITIALLGKVVGLFAVGPLGAIASYMGSTALAVVTGGLSAIETIASNLWFRTVKPYTEVKQEGQASA